MDPSDRLRFDPVAAEGHHVYCYLGIDGPGFAPCAVQSEEEAREVVRIWVDLKLRRR